MQTALAPVFMLLGVGVILNVFATRLARVSDQADDLSKEPCIGDVAERLRNLRLRSRVLDFSVLAAALAAALTCTSVFVLFVGTLLERPAAALLFGLFGGAVLLTMLAINGFVIEMLLATRSVRSRVDSRMFSSDSEAPPSDPLDAC
ncbi:DUF2721 domain-containing protein [Sphingomonas sp. NBWT7]|uniref:DUF2721 domain-containing protein n=1 Tax=Sphingomonas sp. NBWT7 TaxID=2596913 RepID=UPI001C63B94E|nr:DUF2721 domain-containing protein [Sphingomonas sp. NBWT7]